MNDLDALPFGEPTTPPNLGAPPPRRCARHTWVPSYGTAQGGYHCQRCEKPKDEARSRLGKNNRTRGNAKELGWTKRMGLRRVGHHGAIADGLNEMFAGQSKSLATARFPGWMTNELDKLRLAHPELIPVLGILESPGIGKKGRSLVVVDEADWIALHVGGEKP